MTVPSIVNACDDEPCGGNTLGTFVFLFFGVLVLELIFLAIKLLVHIFCCLTHYRKMTGFEFYFIKISKAQTFAWQVLIFDSNLYCTSVINNNIRQLTKFFSLIRF
jgi:hypothetical protein